MKVKGKKRNQKVIAILLFMVLVLSSFHVDIINAQVASLKKAQDVTLKVNVDALDISTKRIELGKTTIFDFVISDNASIANERTYYAELYIHRPNASYMVATKSIVIPKGKSQSEAQMEYIFNSEGDFDFSIKVYQVKGGKLLAENRSLVSKYTVYLPLEVNIKSVAPVESAIALGKSTNFKIDFSDNAPTTVDRTYYIEFYVDRSNASYKVHSGELSIPSGASTASKLVTYKFNSLGKFGITVKLYDQEAGTLLATNSSSAGKYTVVEAKSENVTPEVKPADSNYPTVKYVKTDYKKMLYCNNPEQILTVDLADKNYGKKSLYRDYVYFGNYRAFYEHVNKTGKTIGYTVRLYNPGTTSVNVSVYGSGFEASINGGKPFAQMLSNYNANGTKYVLEPGKVLNIQTKSNAVKNGTFFSGVVDFSVSDKLLIDFIAYESPANISSSLTYQGYIQRIESDGTHEARMYKGLSLYSMVKASHVDFTINDSMKGILPVNVSSYNLTSGQYDSERLETEGWITNIAPGNNANAVHSDMVTFYTLNFGTIDPFSKSDAEGKYPNIANWGVQYVLEGTVKNTGTYARKISINLKAPSNGGIAFAYRGGDNKWYSTRVEAGTDVQYYTFTVPAGKSVSYQAMYILGGPSAGNLTQTIKILN